jgi:hypothetical protein
MKDEFMLTWDRLERTNRHIDLKIYKLTGIFVRQELIQEFAAFNFSTFAAVIDSVNSLTYDD